MRIHVRYSLTTLLFLPLLVGIGIKVYLGPHEYTLAEEREWRESEYRRRYLERFGGVPVSCGFSVSEPPEGTFWAYREFDDTLIRHGPEEEIHASGRRVVKHYARGILHGEFCVLDERGNAIATGQYDAGKRVGEWTFSNTGRHASIVVSDDEGGVDTYRDYHPNGKLKMSGPISSGRWTISEITHAPLFFGDQQGEWRHYNPSGELVSIESFDGGRLIDMELVVLSVQPTK